MPAHPAPVAPDVNGAPGVPDVNDMGDAPDAPDEQGAHGESRVAELEQRLEVLERMVVRQQESLSQHAQLIHRLRMEILALRLLERDQDPDQGRDGGQDRLAAEEG